MNQFNPNLLLSQLDLLLTLPNGMKCLFFLQVKLCHPPPVASLCHATPPFIMSCHVQDLVALRHARPPHNATTQLHHLFPQV